MTKITAHSRRDHVGPYCPGGCMTALESLPLSETVVAESGVVLCRPCWEAEEGYPTTDPIDALPDDPTTWTRDQLHTFNLSRRDLIDDDDNHGA